MGARTHGDAKPGPTRIHTDTGPQYSVHHPHYQSHTLSRPLHTPQTYANIEPDPSAPDKQLEWEEVSAATLDLFFEAGSVTLGWGQCASVVKGQ
jgi:hypothetical protein